jgi:hypothetical protein
MLSDRRARTTANHDISLNGYSAEISRWLGTFNGTVASFIGPAMCREQRFVTAGHVVRVSGLLDGFISIGLKNGVLLGNRLEAAIRHSFAKLAEKVPKGCNSDVLAHDLSDHLRYCFNVLRFMKQEMESPNPSGVSKVTTLRRHAKTAELVVINSLVAKMELNCIPQRSSSSASLRASSPASMQTASPVSSPRSEVKERGLHKAL